MNLMIRTLDQMVEKVLHSGRKYTIAVAWAHDINTLSAIARAVDSGIAQAILIGNTLQIQKTLSASGLNSASFTLLEEENDADAAVRAVELANSDKADIVMKGLLGTDKFLKAILDKEKGLMLPDAVLTFVGAIEIQSYNKLLFITDPAVIPFPSIHQKLAMAQYAVEMTNRFGIDVPKVALIGTSEKPGKHFPGSLDDAEIVKMTDQGKTLNCILDGPLDLFLACDKESPGIKGYNTPVNGDADILIFPSLEASNPFYKSLMLFAGGELAGLIRGTRKPVVVMSRSESEISKFYCIALACLMAD